MRERGQGQLRLSQVHGHFAEGKICRFERNLRERVSQHVASGAEMQANPTMDNKVPQDVLPTEKVLSFGGDTNIHSQVREGTVVNDVGNGFLRKNR